jgi:uncharacterized protein YebE (UPF0316 family)
LLQFRGERSSLFFLAVIEITIWITAISTIIKQVDQSPILILFYSLGFACGNVTGILVERRLAFGKIILKIFVTSNGQIIADKIRSMGQPVTIFQGEGMNGPVLELYIACGRRHLKWLLPVIKEFDEKIFYVIEPARDMSRILRPTFLPRGGWRSRQKNK